MILSNVIQNIDPDVSGKSLEENLRLKGDLELFTYIFSHDLKKPLRVLSNNSSQLIDISKHTSNEIIIDLAQEILQSSDEMQQIINIMLDYIRIEVFKPELQSVNINEILESVLDQYDKKIQIKYDNFPNVIGNRNHLNTVFTNIISNSIKYRDNTRQIEINIFHKEYDDMAEFVIQDNGIGIEEEYFEIIFLLFQRLHTKEEYPGYGGGLAIAKKIIELHGGKIWVESEYGKNTNICFTLKKSF